MSFICKRMKEEIKTKEIFPNEYLMHISAFFILIFSSLYWHTFYKFYSEVTYGKRELVVKYNK